jgi:hypothetical protein
MSRGIWARAREVQITYVGMRRKHTWSTGSMHAARVTCHVPSQMQKERNTCSMTANDGITAQKDDKWKAPSLTARRPGNKRCQAIFELQRTEFYHYLTVWVLKSKSTNLSSNGVTRKCRMELTFCSTLSSFTTPCTQHPKNFIFRLRYSIMINAWYE